MILKSFFCNALLFCLLITHTIFTMQRSDDPNVLTDVIEFAKKMPYATGALLCKDGGQATVIFLNETTAITSAHHFKGRERSAHIVVASDEIDVWFHKRIYNWDLTLQGIKNSGKPWACVKQQYSMPKFAKYTPKDQLLSELTPEYFSKLYQTGENAESIFSKELTDTDLNGEPFTIHGSDISVLKLRTPITLKKKTVTLQAISKDIIASHKAYSFGFSEKKCLNDGTIHNGTFLTKDEKAFHKVSLMCFLADNLQQSKNDQYAFSKLYSIGGQDEQFIIEKLPAVSDKNRFIGLMMSGMSGGPLLFQLSEEEYVLGGINMQTRFQDTKTMINNLISALDENFMIPNNNEHNAVIIKWQEAVKKIGEIPWPIYNVFQLITPEAIAFIEKIMAS